MYACNKSIFDVQRQQQHEYITRNENEMKRNVEKIIIQLIRFNIKSIVVLCVFQPTGAEIYTRPLENQNRRRRRRISF